ncbi:phBC6A51 family helix-turn-helix protein [Secundilactobacillus kimchicus]|uniref:phBC6A51 family helix-turn-helix protein n=1 Tax=Secundilactobacillus kimchicus TaxID=528209 RepID=UPI0024A9ED33|nr:phBC6A51 family helix-turn-helix protein [Secundilactobacillus kimchicus]
MNKSLQNGAFSQLDKRRQDAVVLLFEDELTDEQIAKSVNRSRTTIAKWKNDPKFIQAQAEYRHIAMDSYVPDAIKQLHKLAIQAKSEMVQLQAANAILAMAEFGSAETNVDLQKQQTRKAKAEADVAEYKAKLLTHPDDVEDRTVILDDVSED